MSEHRDEGDAAENPASEQPARPRVVRRSRAEGQQRRAQREKQRQESSWSNIVNAARGDEGRARESGPRHNDDPTQRPMPRGQDRAAERGHRPGRSGHSGTAGKSSKGGRGGPVSGGWSGGPSRRNSGQRSGPGGRGAGRNEGRGGAPKGRRRQPVDPEKDARREKAMELAKEKAIPLAHAHRIVQGRTTLNDVLKLMMRQESFERLVKQDGLDPSLAGQVASGHLSKERALVVTRIRRARKYPLDHDAFKVAETEKVPVLVDMFGSGWVRGRITAVRVYDFDFCAGDGADSELVQKHDVKAVAPENALASIESSSGLDDTIKSQGLAATAERSERVRPTDKGLLALMESDSDITLVLRDGETLDGRVVSFGRWDVTLALADGEDEPAKVTVLFHALHKKSLEQK